MKLFYSPGTSSQLPHIVLGESGLAFEAVRVDEPAKAMASGGDYRTINPLGLVPALQLDDSTILTEGVSIVQYIADKVPAKRLAPPNGTIERARLQSWLNFLSAEVHVGCFCPLFHPELPPATKAMFRERLPSPNSPGTACSTCQKEVMPGATCDCRRRCRSGSACRRPSAASYAR